MTFLAPGMLFHNIFDFGSTLPTPEGVRFHNIFGLGDTFP